jgi:hypothetical protein
MVGNNLFGSSEFAHAEMFGHLKYEHFSSEDATEYLEISLPILRCYLSAKKIKSVETIAKSQLFWTLVNLKIRWRKGLLMIFSGSISL